MKFPTITEIAKEIAEKALDEYTYEGKTIRQWVEVLRDYEDKQTTLQRIVERLEEMFDRSGLDEGKKEIMRDIVKREGLE